MTLLRRVVSISAAVVLSSLIQSAYGQIVIFTEDFETGKPKSGWETYYANEDTLQAVAATAAPAILGTSGKYVGFLQDVNVSYAGSAVAVRGDVSLKDYSIEADVYVYVGQSPSAYSGLVVYADSSKKDFYKLRADFSANNRINLSGLKADTNTFLPLFSKSFYGSGNVGLFPTADGWHKLKVEIQSTNSTTNTIWPYFDGTLLSGAPILDTNATRNKSGKFGLYGFKNNLGVAGYFDNIVVKTLTTASVYEHFYSNVPTGFALGQNYPNPFNPSTTISYQLVSAGNVTLAVFDQLGREVRALVAQPQSAGIHYATWDGKDSNGRNVASGVYVYRLQSGSSLQSKRMILTK